MAHPAAAEGSPTPRMSVVARAAFVAVPATVLAIVVLMITTRSLPIERAHAWVPALGIALAWRIDGLSSLMLLMISGIGTAVFVYAGAYMAGHPGQRRLYVLLTLFLFAMVGCVTTDDVFVLFMFWEATSVLSYLLVGFEHDRSAARRSAQQAVLVTGGGGLALLVGLILLAQHAGTSLLSVMVERLHAMPPTPATTAGLVLVLVGAFTKSAQFPFHFWLPNAMTAPTPVSAFLHSATMVKLGVYLLGRFDVAFGSWDLWVWTLTVLGSVTAAWGMVLALRERDIKRILAWSTVATLGTLVMLIGLRGDDSTIAVGALLLAHALYKAPLFFVAGNVDHGAGTRVIDELGGLRRAMPWTAAAAALAGLSMAGIPLSFGFVVKDAIASAKAAGGATAFVQISNVAFGAIAVAVAAVASVRVFWRHPGRNVAAPDAHEGGLAMVAPPLVLASLGVVLGTVPPLVGPLVSGAASAMLPGTQTAEAGFVQLLSLDPVSVLASLGVTLSLGALIFTFWDPLHRMLDRPVGALMRVGVTAQYHRVLDAIPRWASRITRRLQHGDAHGYVALLLGVTAFAMLAVLGAGRGSIAFAPLLPADAASAGAGLLIVLGAVAAVLLHGRLALVLAAGLVGFGSGLLFVASGAPDVAITQFTVETVSIIILAAALAAFTRAGLHNGRTQGDLRWRHGVVAAGFAGAVTLLMLAALGPGHTSPLGPYFAAHSVPDAHGRNVANVILVDFRALDTLGESSVILLAFLACGAMFGAARRSPVPTEGSMPLPDRTRGVSSSLDVLLPWMHGIFLALSLAVLLRGHNAPGGGFIGGLIAATATIVWSFVRGADAAARRLPTGSPMRLSALGVLVAAAAGWPGLVVHGVYMKHLWGPFGLSTVLVFDLGVYLTVWGGIAGFALALMNRDPAHVAGPASPGRAAGGGA